MSTEYQSPTPPEEPFIDVTSPDAPDYAHEVDIRRLHAPAQRGKREPTAGGEPVPLWLIAVICLALFWSGAYLMTYSGGFNGMVYNAVAFGGAGAAAGAKAGEKGAGGAEAAKEDPIALGQRFFTQTCVACHQTTGMGQPGTYPPLVGSEYVLGDPRRMAAIILHGVGGPLTVNGQHYNNQMQAWGTSLNDKRIAYIMTYVRQSWGNKADPVTPELVAEVRKATASKTTSWTEAELKAFK